jgi:AraC family transcriptional regulator of adaptative response / DNA-3-methyladenine glycosylase II
MTQIAIAAGFGSVRRFNAAIFNVYHRTPTQIRDLAPQKGDHPENQYLFRLEFRPPYAWTRILGVLAAQAIPGVEAVDGGTYRRSISSNGAHGYLEVSLDEARNALNVRVQIAEPRSLFFIIERVRGIFDLNADWATIERTLKADPELAARIEAAPGLRVAGCWSGFELAVRTILDQSGAAAASAVAGRIVQSFGAPFPIAAGVTHLFPPRRFSRMRT